MLLPPPNVTGQLHIGHALMIAIQDSLARYYRMQGHAVTWLPGTDHAGIATQLVVERMLEQEQGRTREDLGRKAFTLEVENREYYTLDKQRSAAVSHAFVRLWKEGLIYRNTRMVNWCVKLQTAVSDVEVKSYEINGPENINGIPFGVLHKFAFPLVDSDGHIEVATTRPETIPGDRAIAVHPDDSRYKHLHYKLAQHPLLPSITLPIIPDAELVNPEFGSGAVKITPAHDVKDYHFWMRHSSSNESGAFSESHRKVEIPLVKIISETGKMTPECGIESLVGHDRLIARKMVISLLKKNNVYRGNENHQMRIGICERSGAIIEPMLQPQWYLRMKPLAEKVIKVSSRDGLKIVPEHPHTNHWERWLSGIQDWCLSRQTWWGHQIPAYMVLNPHKNGGSVERWLAAESYEDAKKQLLNHEVEQGYLLKQDTDVLDTWFSSGLLPLSTAMWSSEPCSNETDRYPLEFVESGGDILFFWLARMAMLCTWFTDKLPFNEILLHPLVCDSQGRKMSKSIGNVIDPLLIVNGRLHKEMIADLQVEFRRMKQTEKVAAKLLRERITNLKRNHPNGFRKSGADTLRITLIDYTKRYTQINMETNQVDHFRKLAIKIYNAFKFFHMARTAASPSFVSLPLESIFSQLEPHDKLLLHKLQGLISIVQTAFTSRKLHEATTAIRQFVFDTFCNMYIEFVKQDVVATSTDIHRRDVVLSLLCLTWDTLLRLLHPFMPYLTETLWQELDPPHRAEIDGASIINALYPAMEDLPTIDAQEFQNIHLAFSLIESLRLYGHFKKDNIKITSLPFVIAFPNTPDGEYVRKMFPAIKMVTRAQGAILAEENNIRTTFAEAEEDWVISWTANLEPGEVSGNSWKIWENTKTEERVLFWCGNKSELGALRSLLHIID
ncbi:tRNA synthetases class I-domain-containing protein [Geopyxis carbonaria]|nr:tRNA synthetases class I-domain-containing protein [Geopyxis carbonaria]